MFWDKLVHFLRWVAALWLAALGVVGVLQWQGLMPDLPKLDPYAWGFSLVIIGVDSLGALIANKVRRSKNERKVELERMLMGMQLTLSRRHVIRFEEISMSVFVPTKWSRFRCWAAPRGESVVRLRRLVQYRPGGYPQQSGIAFDETKGIVGKCWRTRKYTYKDLEPIAASWGDVEMDDARFAKIPHGTRQGFSKDEFMSIVAKYSEIGAEPIWHQEKDGKLIGVVTIDRPRPEGAARDHARLNTRETQEQIATIAKLVATKL